MALGHTNAFHCLYQDLICFQHIFNFPPFSGNGGGIPINSNELLSFYNFFLSQEGKTLCITDACITRKITNTKISRAENFT